MEAQWHKCCLVLFVRSLRQRDFQHCAQGHLGSESPDLNADLRLCDSAVLAALEPVGVCSLPCWEVAQLGGTREHLLSSTSALRGKESEP